MRTDAVSHGEALAPGSQLGEFEVREVLGAGGFGIVYRAFDRILERDVAVKEYMPAALAERGPGGMVSARSSAQASFANGRRWFINEARLLARFDHPSLVKVHRYWEENGTAYMAMPLYRGRTLKACILQRGAPPPEASLRATLDKLLGALQALHAQGVYHRDIAPDNILVCDDGTPVLLDFGAARRIGADGVDASTSILKPTFAAIEQYAESNALPQGAWTDLYALGAVVRCMLTGNAPVPATARAVQDLVAPLATLGLEGYSPAFLAAIDWAMAVWPQDRPQSVAAWREGLEGRAAFPAHPERARARAIWPRLMPTRFGRRHWVPTVVADCAPGGVDPRAASLANGAAQPSFAAGRWTHAASTVFAAMARGRTRAVTRLMQTALELSERTRISVRGAASLRWRGQRLWWLGGFAAALTALSPALFAPHVAGEATRSLAGAVVEPPGLTVSAPDASRRAPERATVYLQEAATHPVSLAAQMPATPAAGAASSPAAGVAAGEARRAAPSEGSSTLDETIAASARAVRNDAAATRAKAGVAQRSRPASPRPAVATRRGPGIQPDPRAECVSRFFLARAWCVDRRCETPRFAGHSECRRLREIADARQLHRPGRP